MRSHLALLVLVHCTWGTYDGKGTSDASIQDGSSDAAPDARTVVPLACNQGPCSAGTTCCIPDQSGPPKCASQGACTNGTLMDCNSPANCPQDQVCCITPGGTGLQYRLLCMPPSQCPQNEFACSSPNDCMGNQCPTGGCRFNVGACGTPSPSPACNPQ